MSIFSQSEEILLYKLLTCSQSSITPLSMAYFNIKQYILNASLFSFIISPAPFSHILLFFPNGSLSICILQNVGFFFFSSFPLVFIYLGFSHHFSEINVLFCFVFPAYPWDPNPFPEKPCSSKSSDSCSPLVNISKSLVHETLINLYYNSRVPATMQYSMQPSPYSSPHFCPCL